MNTSKFPFTILEYSGIWRPKSLTSKWAIKLYSLYSLIIFFNFLAFLISFLIYIILIQNNIIALSESFMFFVGVFQLNLKASYILFQRDNIIYFDNMFLELYCCPRDPKEIAI